VAVLARRPRHQPSASSKSRFLTKSRTQALKAERARKNQLDEGTALIKTVKPLLFSRAAREWLTLKEVRWTASTRRSEGYNVEHLLPHFGTRLLTDITADDVDPLSSCAQARMPQHVP
jgi:hypothetical protein